MSHERDCLTDYLHDLGLSQDQIGQLIMLVDAVVSEEVDQERRACAQIVLKGGDGKERMETAIRYGPNVALVEAILERGLKHG